MLPIVVFPLRAMGAVKPIVQDVVRKREIAITKHKVPLRVPQIFKLTNDQGGSAELRKRISQQSSAIG